MRSTFRSSSQVMPTRIWPGLVALLLMAGCHDANQPNPKAQVIADTNRHIDQGGALLTRFSKINEFTSPYEIATALRMFAHETDQWHRAYAVNRAKMMARGVPRAQAGEVSRRYRVTVEDLRLKVEQLERRLAKRSDGKLYHAELIRVREVMREL